VVCLCVRVHHQPDCGNQFIHMPDLSEIRPISETYTQTARQTQCVWSVWGFVAVLRAPKQLSNHDNCFSHGKVFVRFKFFSQWYSWNLGTLDCYAVSSSKWFPTYCFMVMRNVLEDLNLRKWFYCINKLTEWQKQVISLFPVYSMLYGNTAGC
jgi:hypothetical protein